jgi:hypothetical protein
MVSDGTGYEVLFISEVYETVTTALATQHEQQPLHCQRVRLTGYISQLDHRAQAFHLTHEGHSIAVDTTLSSIPATVYEGELCQILGELRWTEDTEQNARYEVMEGSEQPLVLPSVPHLYLFARICRHVPELDLVLFKQALLARRRFLEGVAR